MQFGQKLKYLRTERGMNQEEFARLIGVTKQAISRYERGDRTPKITIIKMFSESLNVSVEWLVNNQLGISEVRENEDVVFERGDIDEILDVLVTLDKDRLKEARRFIDFLSAQRD